MLTYEQALKDLQDYSDRINTIRNITIEECARVAESTKDNGLGVMSVQIAAAIRALKTSQ